MTTIEINAAFESIWNKGYQVKITSDEIRVFSTEYCEFLDLDTYNSIVCVKHCGDVLGTLEKVLTQSLGLLENEA